MDFPCSGREGVKIARHGMGQPVSPDTCDRTPDPDYIEAPPLFPA